MKVEKAKIPLEKLSGKVPILLLKTHTVHWYLFLTSVNYCLFGWRGTLCLTAAPLLLPFLLGPKLWNVNGKVDAAHGAACGLRRVLLNCSLMLLRRCRPGHFHLHIAPLWKHGINHRILLKPRNETRQIRWLADSVHRWNHFCLSCLLFHSWNESCWGYVWASGCAEWSVCFPAGPALRTSLEHSTGSHFLFFIPWWAGDVRALTERQM